MRSSLNILSTQAFLLHRLHYLCRLSQTSSYPFYLIFVLLTSPILDISTASTSTLTFCKVGCLVDVADIQVHCTIDDFVTVIDEVHCKAIVKEAAVVNARHTWIDVGYIFKHCHTCLRPNFIEYLLLDTQ